MAKKRLLGRSSWRFSDAGNKFDGRPVPSRQSRQKPISPTLKRGIVHCKRCGSRVVSNVNNCPFCGRPLRPFFARLWFWLLIVVIVAVGVTAFVMFNLPEESAGPSSPTNPDLPLVIGADASTPPRNLALGTSIDNSGLTVKVSSVEEDVLTSGGAQLYSVEVSFENTSDDSVILYASQWMLELSDGTRLVSYMGTTIEEEVISSDFEAQELASGARFSGTLYFAVEQPPALSEEQIAAGEEQKVLTPQKVLYQPSALAYDEELLASWTVVISHQDSQQQ